MHSKGVNLSVWPVPAPDGEGQWQHDHATTDPYLEGYGQSLKNELAESTIAGHREERHDADERRIVSWWWWWEIGSMIVSVICLALIIAVLIKADNLALQSWYLPIQPNSLISVFTTVGKSAMMVSVATCLSQLKWRHFQTGARPLRNLQIFDDASRGPWGALMFFGYVRSPAITAFLLAFVTLVGLGFEPSAQQILDFGERTVRMEGTQASMGVANEYVSRAHSNNTNYGATPMDYNLFNQDVLLLRSAYLNGILGTISEPSFNCPPGASHCEWPIFSTMGLCSTFTNLTESIQRNCTTPEGVPTNVSCTFDFPNRNPDDGPVHIDWHMVLKDVDTDNPIVRFGDYYWFVSDMSLLKDSIGGTSGSLSMIRVADMGSYKPERGPDVHLFQSNLYWCQQTFQNVTATPGTLSATPNMTTTPLIPLRNKTAELLDPSEDRQVNDPLAIQDRTVLTYLAGEGTAQTEYSMVAAIPAKTFASLATILTSHWRMYTDPETGLYHLSPGTNSFFPLGFYLNQSNLEAVTTNLAATVSAQIRADKPGDNKNLTMVAGNAFMKETYIQVRWGWLVLPLAVTLMTAGLLVVTVILTRDKPLYKTSVLALLKYRFAGTNGGGSPWGGDDHSDSSIRRATTFGGEGRGMTPTSAKGAVISPLSLRSASTLNRETAEWLEERSKRVVARFESGDDGDDVVRVVPSPITRSGTLR
ncbi:hypothetical protein B0H66DRAFT_620990 [Apodospora peruviana]|uniref:Uncharacterized protein n=1 Tax=Apodospora peruviana TaxID=516989 RepID=A0AAE0IDH0_9PEZI|nr:hypothetical protein B0H66DRAFT_620990 [Apodospora peruviana]